MKTTEKTVLPYPSEIACTIWSKSKGRYPYLVERSHPEWYCEQETGCGEAGRPHAKNGRIYIYLPEEINPNTLLDRVYKLHDEDNEMELNITGYDFEYICGNIYRSVGELPTDEEIKEALELFYNN